MNITQQEIQGAYLNTCHKQLASLTPTQIERRLDSWKEQLELLEPQERLESLLNWLSATEEQLNWAIKTSTTAN